MHELALCGAIAQKVAAHAEGRPVTRVEVRIGHLRQVVPDALTFSWELSVAGTDLDGCDLAVEHVPATVRCGACGAVTTLDTPVMACRSCGGVDVSVVTGDELSVVSLDVVEA